MAHEALSLIPSPERDEGGVRTSQNENHKFNYFFRATPLHAQIWHFSYAASKTLPPSSEAPSAQFRVTLIGIVTPTYGPRLLELDFEG